MYSGDADFSGLRTKQVKHIRCGAHMCPCGSVLSHFDLAGMGWTRCFARICTRPFAAIRAAAERSGRPSCAVRCNVLHAMLEPTCKPRWRTVAFARACSRTLGMTPCTPAGRLHRAWEARCRTPLCARSLQCRTTHRSLTAHSHWGGIRPTRALRRRSTPRGTRRPTGSARTVTSRRRSCSTRRGSFVRSFVRSCK